jgi:hypothetical protein
MSLEQRREEAWTYGLAGSGRGQSSGHTNLLWGEETPPTRVSCPLLLYAKSNPTNPSSTHPSHPPHKTLRILPKPPPENLMRYSAFFLPRLL